MRYIKERGFLRQGKWIGKKEGSEYEE